MPIRVLITTAVAAEADAVATGLLRTLAPVRAPDLPGYVLKRAAYLGPPPGSRPGSISLGGVSAADILAAGVGPAAAAAGTATALAIATAEDRPYGLVISAGIGGGFPSAAPVGSIVVADAIVAADLGAETSDGFLPVDELGFGRTTHLPPEKLSRTIAEALGAAYAPVLTVSTVTGTAERAATLTARHPRAAAEAMEGFGVAEAAAAHGVPVLEIRAISNPVGPRDRAAWQIGRALTQLAHAFRAAAPVLDAWEAQP